MNKPIHRDELRPASDHPGGQMSDPVPLRRPLPPWLAEIEQRLRNGPTLWDTLTEEDWEFFRTYDGPEVLGPPPPPPMPRRPRRRGET